MTTSVSCHRVTPDPVCATFTHDDVSFTALRYTRYPDSPTAPPFTSSSALTATHSTMIDVSDGAPITATVSGAFGAVVSAPAAVSTCASRNGCQITESPFDA